MYSWQTVRLNLDLQLLLKDNTDATNGKVAAAFGAGAVLAVAIFCGSSKWDCMLVASSVALGPLE